MTFHLVFRQYLTFILPYVIDMTNPCKLSSEVGFIYGCSANVGPPIIMYVLIPIPTRLAFVIRFQVVIAYIRVIEDVLDHLIPYHRVVSAPCRVLCEKLFKNCTQKLYLTLNCGS